MHHPPSAESAPSPQRFLTDSGKDARSVAEQKPKQGERVLSPNASGSFSILITWMRRECLACSKKTYKVSRHVCLMVMAAPDLVFNEQVKPIPTMASELGSSLAM